MASKSAKPSKPKIIVYAPLPSVIVLTKKTALLLWSNKTILGGIAVVYGLFSLVFVRGFGAGLDVANIRSQFGSQVVGSFAVFTQLIGDSSSSSNQGGNVYQLFFFIIASLAIIWALRQVVAGEKVSLRSAYYRGMYPLVPFMLVLAAIGLQLLPMLIGVSLYQLVVATGIAATNVEVALWGLGALALTVVSLYLLVSSLMALYIVTLPNMTPMQALRSSGQLVRGRRWMLLRKMLFLPVVLFVAACIITLPFILVAPVLAGWVLFVLGILVVVAAHGYLYTLYRESLNEQ